jgi:hypothetical protein
MKRIVSMAFGVLALSVGVVMAQGPGRAAAPPPPLEAGASQADVDRALTAAPDQLKAQATVIKWNADHQTYTTLRKGTNNLVCYDRSGFPLQQAFSTECTSMGNIERVKQNLKFESAGDRTKLQDQIKQAEANGTRVKPEYGSVFYHAMGQDANGPLRHHMTIAVPNATAQSTGLPDNGRAGTVWVMDAGTTGAHLMIPGE